VANSPPPSPLAPRPGRRIGRLNSRALAPPRHPATRWRDSITLGGQSEPVGHRTVTPQAFQRAPAAPGRIPRRQPRSARRDQHRRSRLCVGRNAVANGTRGIDSTGCSCLARSVARFPRRAATPCTHGPILAAQRARRPLRPRIKSSVRPGPTLGHWTPASAEPRVIYQLSVIPPAGIG
jgi:hypothetical protein